MTAFRASLDGTAAVLQWETSSETDNAGFEVQRQGPDASGYVDEGFVEGAGTTNEPRQYRFCAEELETGEHQFRLRQVDTEGTATLSDPVAVRVRPPRVLSLEARGPNPVRTTAQLSFTVPETQTAQVSLYNVIRPACPGTARPAGTGGAGTRRNHLCRPAVERDLLCSYIYPEWYPHAKDCRC